MSAAPQFTAEQSLAMYRAINNYFETLERIADLESWQWALNEMADEVIGPWNAAMAQMREAIELAEKAEGEKL